MAKPPATVQGTVQTSKDNSKAKVTMTGAPAASPPGKAKGKGKGSKKKKKGKAKVDAEVQCPSHSTIATQWCSEEQNATNASCTQTEGQDASCSPKEKNQPCGPGDACGASSPGSTCGAISVSSRCRGVATCYPCDGSPCTTYYCRPRSRSRCCYESPWRRDSSCSPPLRRNPCSPPRRRREAMCGPYVRRGGCIRREASSSCSPCYISHPPPPPPSVCDDWCRIRYRSDYCSDKFYNCCKTALPGCECPPKCCPPAPPPPWVCEPVLIPFKPSPEPCEPGKPQMVRIEQPPQLVDVNPQPPPINSPQLPDPQPQQQPPPPPHPQPPLTQVAPPIPLSRPPSLRFQETPQPQPPQPQPPQPQPSQPPTMNKAMPPDEPPSYMTHKSSNNSYENDPLTVLEPEEDYMGPPEDEIIEDDDDDDDDGDDVIVECHDKGEGCCFYDPDIPSCPGVDLCSSPAIKLCPFPSPCLTRPSCFESCQYPFTDTTSRRYRDQCYLPARRRCFHTNTKTSSTSSSCTVPRPRCGCNIGCCSGVASGGRGGCYIGTSTNMACGVGGGGCSGKTFCEQSSCGDSPTTIMSKWKIEKQLSSLLW